MPDMKPLVVENLAPEQAAELALLVELEARWENLRTGPARPPQLKLTSQGLAGMQKAYEAFRAKLSVYNKRYAPAHVPELLLNTPVRLGLWCRAMRELYLRVEDNLQAHCPVNLVEKGFRWADRLAGRISTSRIDRTTPPDTIQAAIRDLDALVQWCDELARATTPQPV